MKFSARQMQDILHKVSGFAPGVISPIAPPSLPEAGRITYIGLTLSQKPIVKTKVYYRPEKSIKLLSRYLDGARVAGLESLDASLSEMGGKLYDCSLEMDSSAKGSISPRLLWSIPFSARTSREALQTWVSCFLEKCARPACATDLMNVNQVLFSGRGSSIQPMYLIGGYLNDSDQIEILKCDYDPDIVTDLSCKHKDPVYENQAALEASVRALESLWPGMDCSIFLNFGANMIKNGHNLEIWGTHSKSGIIDEFKVYFSSKWHDPCVSLDWLCRWAKERSIRNTEACQQLASCILPMGLCYYGFNVAFTHQGVCGVRLYFRA